MRLLESCVARRPHRAITEEAASRTTVAYLSQIYETEIALKAVSYRGRSGLVHLLSSSGRASLFRFARVASAESCYLGSRRSLAQISQVKCF